MKPREKNTFWACIGGWILDAMDVQILSFAIPTIVAAFRDQTREAGFIGTVDAVHVSVRRLGRGRFGRSLRPRAHAADHHLVVRVLHIPLRFRAELRTASHLPCADGLRLWRRVGRAAVLIGEVIRPEHRGKAVGAMQSGWAIGWAIAVLL